MPKRPDQVIQAVVRILAVSSILIAGPAMAQSAPPPTAGAEETTNQPPSPDTIDELIDSIKVAETDREESPAGVTDDEVAPPLIRPDTVSLPIPRLLPEGARIVRRRGWLERDRANGAWTVILIPDPEDRRGATPPVTLLPSRRLEYAESLAAANEGEPTPVELSGQVYVYDDRNYVMAAQLRRVETMGAGSTPPAEDDDESSPPPTDDPTVDSMIQSLRDRDPAAAAPPSTREPSPEAIASEDLLPEGTYIVSRLGRIVRSRTTGEWLFRFESDTSGQQDPPVVLLPCRMLTLALRMVHEDGDAVKLLLSGPVYRYHERNYVIPTVIQRPYPRENLTPAGG